MGRLATKQLSPGYTGSGKNDLESLTYTYNIHNNITSINKDYALKTPGKYNKWGNFFGLYLGYDNRDAVFTTRRLDGTVTGLLWNKQGDDAQRKFNFTYDNAGRLTSANFKEKQTPGETWGSNKMDFSTTGSTGKITYDLHGNLLNMIQKGVLPGGAAPVNIDNLSYTYASLSNKLTKVTDNSTAGSANGKSGDFADGSNSGDDYIYDDNGNLIIDLNKNITGVTGGISTPLGTSGITYNFLDKPELIRIAGKGTIQIVYDADGNKLQRKFTPEGGTARTTTYINEFVYLESALSFIHFEEGRIRVMTAVSENNGYDGLAIDGNMNLPNGKRGAYDYFIRDYQQNVRMILTEQTHYGIHQATMEPERAGNEEPVFGQTGAGNEVVQTRSPRPPGWAGNSSASVSRLGALTHKAGPNVLLKVMAGDQISATTNYYYKDPVTNSTGNNLSGSIITSLIQSILGSPATGLTKTNTTGVANQLNANTGFLNKTAPDANNPNGNNPKAYLTIVFFNERFEFVNEGSTPLRVTQAGDNAPALVLPNIKAPKNGYAYVYLSNEHAEAVYFDDFKVAHTRGRIIEENHYYAFGLKIAGISSAKFGDENEGSLKNDYLYNDKELWDDADLNWYDYGFRNYDPQTGRFPQLDPLTWDYPYYTPYQYAGNEPIANVDLDGLEPLNSIINTAIGEAIVTKSSFLQEVVVKSVSKTAPAVAKTSTVTTRIFGGLKAVGGILEAGVGVAGGIATSWTGVGAVGGGLVAAHGLDVAASGLNQLIFGTETKSFTEKGINKGLQISGMSEDRANQWAANIDGGISIVGSGYAGGGLLKGASVGGGASTVTGAAVKTVPLYTKSNLQLGQQMHKAYHGGKIGKEFRLLSGKRIDYLDIQNGIIHELKPFNPRAMKAGERQLQMYLKELQSPVMLQKYPEFRGINWKTILDTY